MSFWIVAEMTVKPELKAEFLAEVQTLVNESNKEPGMVVYTLTQQAEGPKALDKRPEPLKFAMVEQYKNLDAFKFHSNSAHYKRWSQVSSKYRTMDGFKFLAPVVVDGKGKM